MTYRAREVFQPPLGQENSKELFKKFCKGVYSAGNCMEWIDESAYVTSPQYMPDELEILLIGGRTRGVGCMALSQSPAGLSHPMLFKAAEHIYVGYGNDYMLKSLIEYLGYDVLAATSIVKGSGEFLLWRGNEKTPVKIRPVDVSKLGKNYVRTE